MRRIVSSAEISGSSSRGTTGAYSDWRLRRAVKRLVLITPGGTRTDALTGESSAASWPYRLSITLTIAALAIEYTGFDGIVTTAPLDDDVPMTCPGSPWASRLGTKALMPLITPQRW